MLSSGCGMGESLKVVYYAWTITEFPQTWVELLAPLRWILVMVACELPIMHGLSLTSEAGEADVCVHLQGPVRMPHLLRNVTP